MSDNANAIESTLRNAQPDRGYWEEMPLPIGLWHAGGGSVTITESNDTGAEYMMIGSIGAPGGVTAGGGSGAAGTPGTSHLACSIMLPQLMVGDTPGSNLNLQSAGSSVGGPWAELLLLARAHDGGGAATETLEVFGNWLESYAASAAYRLGTAQVTPAMVNHADPLPTTWRWVNVPLLRPAIPATTPPHTQAQRDALNTTLRTNNLPLPFTLLVQNSNALAAGEIIDIAGGILRYRRHAGSRLPTRLDFTNGGTIALATALQGAGAF